MSKLITYEQTAEYLNENYPDWEDVVGLINDIANGVHSWEQLSEGIREYSEHNQ